MKKLFIALVGMSVLAGCTAVAPSTPFTPSISNEELPVLQYAEPGSDWVTYEDPLKRFTLRYPPDWLQTDAQAEVQFWDNLDDDVNSVKLALVSETRTNEQIQAQVPEDLGPNFRREFYTYDVNGHPTFTEVGWSDLTQYRTYYYELNDGTRLAFIAWLHDADDTNWQNALSVQQSFQWWED